ncbi:MAG: hypothetical protein HZA90_25435 [Verrucomicrobia bacterium]|nr:hypothetical protein [Verrucomicrobiota bacterium]
MQTNAKGIAGLFLVLVVAWSGCSPQKTLAHRLAGADRVIVTNSYDRLSITVTGEEVNKVVQAIATGRKENRDIQATPGLDFQFFKGVEHLETITTAIQVFWIARKPYIDQTGMLEALAHRFREEHPPLFSH